MFKRMTRGRVAVRVGGLLLTSACTAQSGTPPPYTEGATGTSSSASKRIFR